jgi:hypothetical protein
MRRARAPRAATAKKTVRMRSWSVETAGPLAQYSSGHSASMVQQANSIQANNSSLLSGGSADGRSRSFMIFVLPFEAVTKPPTWVGISETDAVLYRLLSAPDR